MNDGFMPSEWSAQIKEMEEKQMARIEALLDRLDRLSQPLPPGTTSVKIPRITR